MAKGKCKHLTNGNQDHSPLSEPSTPTSASPAYPNTPEKQELDTKSYLMILIEDFNKGINNSLKEIQENTVKEIEGLKELQENTTKTGDGIEKNHPRPKKDSRNNKETHK